MKRELSILIPIYNDCCTLLVEQLHRQALAVGDFHFEIIVAEDGSKLEGPLAANKAITALPYCRHIIRGVNVGRAAIRNFLAQQARYEWLLFIDGDMSVTNNEFLLNYLRTDASEVVYGGYRVGEGDRSNLRYRYEKASEPFHTAEQRRQKPYRDFHTSNFLIHRDLMLAHPFDERFRRYGYEDVLFGKHLRQAGVSIFHIDNPVGFDTFEDNATFVEKTEEGLRTLHDFRDDLRGYNGLLTFVSGIHVPLVKWLFRLFHLVFASLERRKLCGRRPSLFVFKLYKLGYYLTLTKND